MVFRMRKQEVVVASDSRLLWVVWITAPTGRDGCRTIHLHDFLMKDDRKIGRKRLIALAIAIVASFSLMEVALRMISPLHKFVNPMSSFNQFDAELGWLGIPNANARFCKPDFDVQVKHNADGFRLKVRPTTTSNLPICAVFGDSFTWGWGVAEGQIFTDVIQDMARNTADIQNFGVNATGTFQQALLLKRLVQNGYKPSRVIIMFFANDFSDCIAQDGRKPWLKVTEGTVSVENYPVTDNPLSRGPWTTVRKSSKLLSTIAYVYNLWKERSQMSQTTGTFVSSGPTPEAEVAVRFALTDISQTCHTAGIDLLVVFVPELRDLVNQSDSLFAKSLFNICQTEKIPFFNPTEAMRARAGEHPENFFFPHDQHWTANGHRAVGQAIADQLGIR